MSLFKSEPTTVEQQKCESKDLCDVEKKMCENTLKIYEPDNEYVKVSYDDIKINVIYYKLYAPPQGRKGLGKKNKYFPGKFNSSMEFTPEPAIEEGYSLFAATIANTYRLKQAVMFELLFQTNDYVRTIEKNKKIIAGLQQQITTLQSSSLSGGKKYNLIRKNISRKFAYKKFRKSKH
jgi:hypothetical protein